MNNKEQEKLYNNLINKYKKTGKIGRTKPFNLEHAKRIAWTITQKIINTTSSPTHQLTEPLTGWRTCCQLRLF